MHAAKRRAGATRRAGAPPALTSPPPPPPPPPARTNPSHPPPPTPTSFDGAHSHSAQPGQKRLIWLEGSTACESIDFDNIHPHNAGVLRQALQRVAELGSEAVLPASSAARTSALLRILDLCVFSFFERRPRALATLPLLLLYSRGSRCLLLSSPRVPPFARAAHLRQVHRWRVHAHRFCGIGRALLWARRVRRGANVPRNCSLESARAVQGMI